MKHELLVEEGQTQGESFFVRHNQTIQISALVFGLIVFVTLIFVLIAFTTQKLPESTAAPPSQSLPSKFKVVLETTVLEGDGKIIMEIIKDQAPYAAQRLFELLRLPNGSYYDDSAFWKVFEDVTVQFGINGNPAIRAKYDVPFPSDPMLNILNTKGTVVFAVTTENDRRTQLMINLEDNASLDAQGNPPIGSVIQGMDIASKIYSGYHDQPDEHRIYTDGNSYLRQNYPLMDYVKRATILSE